jgi:hypothetical protein
MKLFAATVMALSLLASACSGVNQARVASGSYAPSDSGKQSQTINITRSGSRPSRQALAQYFTGSVRIDPLFETKDPSHTSGSYVTFEPGARSAWHTHPLGQTLIVTAGTGRVQRWGESRRGNPAGRCGVDSAGSKTLAWSVTDYGNDAHRHPGSRWR